MLIFPNVMETRLVLWIFEINFTGFKRTRLVDFGVTQRTDTSSNTSNFVKRFLLNTARILVTSSGHFFHNHQSMFVIGFQTEIENIWFPSEIHWAHYEYLLSSSYSWCCDCFRIISDIFSLGTSNASASLLVNHVKSCTYGSCVLTDVAAALNKNKMNNNI